MQDQEILIASENQNPSIKELLLLEELGFPAEPEIPDNYDVLEIDRALKSIRGIELKISEQKEYLQRVNDFVDIRMQVLQDRIEKYKHSQAC